MVASAVRATPIINFLEYSLRCVQIPNSKIPSVKCHLLQQYRTLANMSLSKNKIPEPPKQPSSSFLEFFKRKRNEILKLNPDLKQTEIVKRIASSWNGLSAEEKKPYKDKYSREYLEFKNLKAVWWNNLTASQKEEYLSSKEETKKTKARKNYKKKIRQLGKPKRPLSAFNFFMSLNHDKFSSSQKLYLTSALQKWKDMTDQEKQPYIELAEKDVERYNDEMHNWELKMLKEGHEDLLRKNSTVSKEVSEVSSRPQTTLHSKKLVKPNKHPHDVK